MVDAVSPAVADAWRAAYLVNRERSYANPIPSSLDLLSHLRRWGHDARRNAVIRSCRELNLPLADMPHEVPSE